MISIDDKTIVSGIALGSPSYKDAGGNILKGTFFVANDASSADMTIPVYVCGEVALYKLEPLALIDGYVYNLSGVTSPSNVTVYLSVIDDVIGLTNIMDSVILETQSDENGSFYFENLSYSGSDMYVWFKTDCSNALSAGLSVSIEVVESSITEKLTYQIYSAGDEIVQCSVCSGAGIMNSGDACHNCSGEKNIVIVSACSVCGGSGTLSEGGDSCMECGGSGKVEETVQCPVCDGTGVVPDRTCDTCTGLGVVQDESGNETSCPTCDGSGTVKSYTCSSCGGSGVVSVPFMSARYSLSGSCPSDVTEVHLSLKSYVAPGAAVAYTDSELAATKVISVVPTDGKYTVSYDVGSVSNIVIWAITSTDEVVTIDNVVTTESAAVCLSGDTLITMADGTYRRLDELNEGEFVLSANGFPSKIHMISRGRFNDYHTKYYFGNGVIIDETHAHRFFNSSQGFWQLLENWNVGDYAVDQNGRCVELVSSERIDETCEMFGIWTDTGDYYANGLLSGSAYCNKELLSNATAEQAVDMMLSLKESVLYQLIGLKENIL